MRRFGNARTIQEIESIVGRPDPGVERLAWLAGDVACTLTKHRHAGTDYSWAIDVLTIRRQRQGRPWHLMLTTEHWRSGGTDVRAAKWLKVISGRTADVAAWIAASRKDPAGDAYHPSSSRSIE
jgi:hypothetical protein